MFIFDKEIDFDPYLKKMGDKRRIKHLLALHHIFSKKFLTYKIDEVNDESNLWNDQFDIPYESIRDLNLCYSIALSYIFTFCKERSFYLIYDFKSEFDDFEYQNFQESNPNRISSRIIELLGNIINLLRPIPSERIKNGFKIVTHGVKPTSSLRFLAMQQIKHMIEKSVAKKDYYDRDFADKRRELNYTESKMHVFIKNNSDLYERLGYRAALSSNSFKHFQDYLDSIFTFSDDINLQDLNLDFTDNHQEISIGKNQNLSVKLSEWENTLQMITQHVLQLAVLTEMNLQFQYQNKYNSKYNAQRIDELVDSYARLEQLKKPKIAKSSLAHLLVAKTRSIEHEGGKNYKIVNGRFAHDSVSNALSEFFTD